MSFQPLSLKDFYAETLKQAGFTPPEDSIEKFAEANKIDPQIAKIASSVFEQLQLDGVKYASSKEMFDDAIKIANAYANHVTETSAAAEKIAGDLHRVARHAVEGYLATQGITDITADDGVKIAGLQAQSFLELTQKQAALRQQDEAKAATFRVDDRVPGGSGMMNNDASLANLHASFGGTPEELPGMQKQITAEVGPEKFPAYLDAMHATKTQNPQMSWQQAHQTTMGKLNTPAPAAGGIGNAIAKHPGVALGAGALGLGALYMMKKKRDEAAAGDNRRNAIMGAASMPAA